MNILLIDDDKGILKLVSKILTNHGHNVVSAEDGQAGLDIFLKEPIAFDIIISDVMMPVMDGLELLRKIRQHNADIPFVVTTGFSDTDMVIKALKHGATDFLQKPYNAKVILGAINRIESMLNTKQSIEQTLPFINATFQTSMPSRTELIPGLVGFLKRIAKPYCQLYGISIADIITSLTEAITNAVVHGNLGVPSSLKKKSWEKFQEMVEQRESIAEYGDKLVYVCFQVVNMNARHQENTCKLDSHGEFVEKEFMESEINKKDEKKRLSGVAPRLSMQWEVVDNGKGFDYTCLPDMLDTTKCLLSGRGVFLIRSFMDEVSWNSEGNTIQMVKYLQK